jgi:hypothetical protein
MSSEFSNTTIGGYFFSRESSNEWPQPIDPPDNTGGGGLPGEPVRPDYVYPPSPIDPPEPLEQTTPSQNC